MLVITFKENCPDVRNTKIVDLVKVLEDDGIKVTIYDPWENPRDVKDDYNITSSQNLPNSQFDALISCVVYNDIKLLNKSKTQK